jgi:hypothetical protein
MNREPLLSNLRVGNNLAFLQVPISIPLVSGWYDLPVHFSLWDS